MHVNVAIRRRHFLPWIFRVLFYWLQRIGVTRHLTSAPSPHHFELVVFFGQCYGTHPNGSPDLRDTAGGFVSSFWGHSWFSEPMATLESVLFTAQDGRLAVKNFFPSIDVQQPDVGSSFHADDAYEYSRIVCREVTDDVEAIWKDVAPGLQPFASMVKLPNGENSDVRVIDEEYKLRGNCCADRAIRVAQSILHPGNPMTPPLDVWMDYAEFCDHFRGGERF